MGRRNQLYKNLINSKAVTEYAIGTEDEFISAMSSPEKAGKIYDNLINKTKLTDKNIGTREQFIYFIAPDFRKQDNIFSEEYIEQSSDPSVEITSDKTKNLMDDNPFSKYTNGIKGLIKPEQPSLGSYEEIKETGDMLHSYEVFRQGVDNETNRIQGEIKKGFELPEVKAANISKASPYGMAAAYSKLGQKEIDNNTKSDLNAYKNYKAANDLIEETKKTADASKNNSGFWKGVGDNILTEEAVTFGLSAFGNSLQLKSLLNKVEKEGIDSLTPSENTLLEAASVKSLSDMIYESGLSSLYNVGSATGTSIPYMLQFVVTHAPASAIAKPVMKKLSGYVTKRFGEATMKKAAARAISTLPKVGTKTALKTANALTKTGAAALEAGATGALMPIIQPTVYNDILERRIGQVDADINPQTDRVQYKGQTGEKSWGRPIVEGYTAGAIENLAEMSGGAIMKALGLPVNALSKISPKSREFINIISEKPLLRSFNRVREDIAKTTGVHSIPGEALEEFVGQTANALTVGDQKLEDIYTWENAWMTLASVAPLSIGMGSASGVMAQAAKKKVVRDYNRASKKLSEAYSPDLVEYIKSRVGGSPEQQAMIIRQYYDRAREAKNEEEKRNISNEYRLVMDYATAVNNYDAYIGGIEARVANEVSALSEQIRNDINPDMNATVYIDYDGQQARVTSGNIVFDENGDINDSKSDDTITIELQDGTKQMVSPDKFKVTGYRSFDDQINEATQNIEKSILSQEDTDVYGPDPVLDEALYINTDNGPVSVKVTRADYGGFEGIQIDESGKEITEVIDGIETPVSISFSKDQIIRLDNPTIEAENNTVIEDVSPLQVGDVVNVTGFQNPVTFVSENNGDAIVGLLDNAGNPIINTEGKQVQVPVKLEQIIHSQTQSQEIKEETSDSASPVEEEVIPMRKNKKGEQVKDYVSMPDNMFVEHMINDYGNEAAKEGLKDRKRNIDSLINRLKKRRDKSTNTNEKIDIDDEINDLKSRLQILEELSQNLSNEPNSFKERLNSLSEPVSLEDYILQGIASGEYKFKWGGKNGLSDELGLKSDRERRSRIGILKNDGYTPETLAERIFQEIESSQLPFSVEELEIRNSIIDILNRVHSRKRALEESESLQKEFEDQQIRAQEQNSDVVEELTPEELQEIDEAIAELKPIDDIRFRTTDVDRGERKDLIAVHNISEEKLKEAIDLGGFPMPSIAVTKSDVGHITFGDISLVFDKESINPTDRRNRVYGEDAWTPTFPSVGYKLNDDKTIHIYRRANKVGSLPLFNPVYFHPDNYKRHIDRLSSESLVNYFKDNYDAKQLYLSETGNAVEEYERHEVEKYNTESVALYEKILKEIGIERLRNEGYDTLKDDIKQLINRYYGIDLDKRKPIFAKIQIQNTINHAYDYAENGNKKTENDLEATKKKIDERIDPKKFEAWLEDLFFGVVEKKGIRNDKDLFTPSGNRRKWEQLYDEITLDNVVNAMKKQVSKGGEGLFGTSIFGSAQEEYKSIDEIRRAARERIRTMDETDYQAQRDAITNRLSNISIPGVGNGFSDTMDILRHIQDAVSRSHTAKGIHKYLKYFYPRVTMETANEIEDIVKDIQRMNARYFEAKPYRSVGFDEAKPYRSVGFDEVKLAVVPSDTNANLVERLKSLGIEVRTYERGKDKQRKQIVKEATDEMNLRFRFIGEEGATNLDRSEEATTRLDNLNVAREMENAFEEKKARIEKLRNSEPVEITGEEYKGKYELNRDSAQEFILNNLRGSYTIVDTGEKVNLSKVGAKKVTSHSMGNEAHLKSIVAIPQLLGNAIFIEERPNEKRNGKYDSYRYYVTGLKIGNENFTVRLTIGVKNGKYYYDHYLTEIEKGNLIEIANGFTPTGDAPVPSYTVGEDTRLISLLQTNDQENARKIKLATGWERGTDGKWQYDTEVKLQIPKEEKINEIKRLSDILNTEVEIYETQSDLPTSIQEKANGEISGYYMPGNDKVAIVLDANVSIGDIQATMLHEIVGHKGIRGLFGNRTEEFLDKVFESMDVNVRAEYMERFNSERLAAEEYLSELAEYNPETSGIKKIIAIIRDFFREILGIDLKLSDNDIVYILSKSRERLQNSRNLSENKPLNESYLPNEESNLTNTKISEELKHTQQETEETLYRLKSPVQVDVSGDSAIEAAEKISGVQYLQRVIDKDIYRNISYNTLNRNAIQAVGYGRKKLRYFDKRKMENAYKGLFDNMNDLHNLQKTIIDTYGSIDDSLNAYYAENASSSRAQDRTNRFQVEYEQPLINTLAKIRKKFNNDDFMMKYYPSIRTIIERQRVITEKKIKEAQNDPKIKDDRQALFAAIQLAEKKDYSGQTGTYKEILAHKYSEFKFPANFETMTYDEVKDFAKENNLISMDDFVERSENILGNDLVNEFWNNIRKISQYKLYNDYQTGMISRDMFEELTYGVTMKELAKKRLDAGEIKQEQYDLVLNTFNRPEYLLSRGIITENQYNSLKPRYEYYLPLKGTSEIEADEINEYNNKKVKNISALKAVEGHENVARDPLPQLLQDVYGSIMSQEQNRWRNTLLNMLRKYPIPNLYHIQTEYFTPIRNGEGNIIEYVPYVKMVNDKLIFVPTDEELKAKTAIRKRKGLDLDIEINKRQSSEHAVTFLENGDYVTVYFTDPRIAQSINNLNVNTLPTFLDSIMKWGGKINRFRAQFMTTVNPEFVIANVIKDFQEANSNIMIKEGLKYAKEFNKIYLNPELGVAIRRRLNGKKGDTEIDKSVDEFFKYGGETAYNMLPGYEQKRKDLYKEIKKINKEGNKAILVGSKAKDWIGDNLEMFNKQAELRARIATYIASRKYAKREISRSIWDAKEVTVNFDKKGSWAKGFGFYQLFWNAGRQSNRMQIQMIKTHPVKWAIVKSINTAMGFAETVLPWLILDDDDRKNYLDKYFSITPYLRYSNLIMGFGGELVTIPLPPAFIPSHTLGVCMAEMVLRNNEPGFDPTALVIDVANAGANEWLPEFVVDPVFDIANDKDFAVSTVLPPQLKPFAEIYDNRNFFGSPIYNDNINEFKPAYQRIYNGTGPTYINLAQFLNNWTGGNEVDRGFIQLNPAMLEHLVDGYVSGAGRFWEKTFTTLSGNAESAKDIPILSRFWRGDINNYLDRDEKNTYYRLLKQAEKYRYRRNEYRKLNGYESEKEELKKEGELYEPILVQIRKLNRYKRLEKNTSDPKKKEKYKNKQNEIYEKVQQIEEEYNNKNFNQ